MVGTVTPHEPPIPSSDDPLDQDKPAHDEVLQAAGERVHVGGSSVVVHPGDTLVWLTDGLDDADAEHVSMLADLLPDVTIAVVPSPNSVSALIVYRPEARRPCRARLSPERPTDLLNLLCHVDPVGIHRCSIDDAEHTKRHVCRCSATWPRRVADYLPDTYRMPSCTRDPSRVTGWRCDPRLGAHMHDVTFSFDGPGFLERFHTGPPRLVPDAVYEQASAMFGVPVDLLRADPAETVTVANDPLQGEEPGQWPAGGPSGTALLAEQLPDRGDPDRDPAADQ